MKNNLLCKIFGHKWLFKNYTNYLEVDGQKYPYLKSRICTRCQLRQVTKDNNLWVQSQL